jgi:hypothetical protein
MDTTTKHLARQSRNPNRNSHFTMKVAKRTKEEKIFLDSDLLGLRDLRGE